MVSTFGRVARSGECVFAADHRSKSYETAKNIRDSQNWGAEFALHDYPVTGADILERGQDAS
jgi:acyl-CoA dehydrogenase